VGCHVDAAQRVCDGLKRNKIVRVGKNSGPVLYRLWTKIREIRAIYRRLFVLSNAFARLSMSCFVQQIFAIKYPSCLKLKKCKKNWAPVFQRDDPNFSTVDCYRDLPSTVWQSLVEFHL